MVCQNGFILGQYFFCIIVVELNKLASIRNWTNCSMPQEIISWGTSLFDGFLPHFYVFININEYANEIIFTYDYWIKGLVELYHG